MSRRILEGYILIIQYINISIFLMKYMNIYQYISIFYNLLITVESLEFVVAQFSWYSWISISHEFKSSTKTYFEKSYFFY